MKSDQLAWHQIHESIILKFAKPHFFQAYGNNHFGFRSESSMTCALIILHDHITKCLDPHVVGVQVILYDFSKAFDRLRHDVIINRSIDYACILFSRIQSITPTHHMLAIELLGQENAV